MASATYMSTLRDSYFQISNKKIRPVSYLNPVPKFVSMKSGGADICFKRPEMIRRRTIEEGYVSLEFEPLSIFAAGETLVEAKSSFWEDVDFMWRNYVRAADEELTQDARNLKEKLKEYLTEDCCTCQS